MKKNKPFQKAQKLVTDFDLWVKVSKSVTPAKLDLAAQLDELAPVSQKPMPMRTATRMYLPQKAPQSKSQRQSSGYELSGIERSQQKRMLRGKVEPDARIDLHGESLETARLKLYRFLRRCYEQQHRTILVITGKGSNDFTRHTLHSRDFYAGSARTGRLRQALPNWLNELEFRTLVTGYQPSHPRHGGGGAFYIRLRNKNRMKNRK